MIALRVYFLDNSYRTVLLHDNAATASEVVTMVSMLIGLPPQHGALGDEATIRLHAI